MNIAKNVLVRITGMDFGSLAFLNLHETLPLLSEYEAELDKNELLKNEAIDLIYNCIQKSENRSIQNILLKLKRDVYNNRGYDWAVGGLNNLNEITDQLNKLRISDLVLSELANSIEELFHEEYTQIRTELKTLTQHPSFQNGIILSSAILAESVKKYLTPKSNRKRDAQTELGLTSYISRIAAKTSPFSSFTNLGLAVIDEAEKTLSFKTYPEIKSKVSLNNYLLKSIIGIIKLSPFLHKDVPVVLNQTIKLNDGKITFITNSNNSEAFQTIENSDLLKLIFEILNKQSQVTINEVIEIVQQEFELEDDSLYEFLLQLISLGVLEYDFPVSGADENWVSKLLAAFKNIPENESFYELLASSFTQIEKFRNEYEYSQPSARQEILGKLDFEITNLFEKLRESYIIEKVKIDPDLEPDDSEKIVVFHHRDPIALSFKPEMLIFEDTLIDSDIKIGRQAVSEIISKIDLFLNNFQFLNPNSSEQEIIKEFYKQNYPGSATVSVVDFYMDYQKNRKNLPEIKGLYSEVYQAFQKKVIDLIARTENPDSCIMHFKTDDFLSDSFKSGTASKGSFLQFFINSSNKLSCVINGVFTGHNKLFGRFITLFDKSVQADILSWSREDYASEIFAENCDSTYFNANIHPPLLNFEIDMPGSQNTYSKNKRIMVKDLAVKYESATDSVELVDEKSGKKTNIFDLGFQSMKARSGLFTFLNRFDSPSTFLPFSYFNSIVNKRFTQIVGKGSVLPRIVLDNQIVIQRKTWMVDKHELPRIDELSTSKSFVQVNRWRNALSVPDQVFFYFNVPKGAADDDKKPQYLDFRSPLLINLFIKKVQKSEKQLVMQEMLPDGEQLFTSASKKFVSEYLVQWR